MSIHIVKVRIEGYILNLDGDNDDRLPVYDWPPETIINEMHGCVVSTRILDTIAEDVRLDVQIGVPTIKGRDNE